MSQGIAGQLGSHQQLSCLLACHGLTISDGGFKQLLEFSLI